MTSEDGSGETKEEGSDEPNVLLHDRMDSAGGRLLKNAGSLKVFFSVSGGSILYCLSALSILYGIAKLMTGLLAKSSAFGDTLPCIIAINIYELALLSVLVIIVLWRNVTDDAISLVVLVALFQATSGTVLGAGAYHAARICFYLGLGCIVLAIAKLYVMRRYVGFAIGRLSLAGMGVIFAWNFLTSSVMSGAFAGAPATGKPFRGLWLTAWLVLLAGGVVVLADAVRSKPCRVEGSRQRPFLHSPSMVWIFALIVLAAGGVGQYGNAYMYAVNNAFGDYIPLIGIGSLLAVELIGRLKERAAAAKIAVSLVPLVCTAFAISERSIMARRAMNIELLWYPPVMLALIGAGVLLLSIRRRCHWLGYAALAYALACLLTIGFSPDAPHELSWRLAGAGLIAVLFVLGVVHRNVVLCFGAAAAFAAGLSTTDAFMRFAAAHDLSRTGAAAGVAGLGTLAVCLAFGRKTPRIITVFAAVSLAAFVFDYLGPSPAWRDAAAAAGTAIAVAVLWLRTGEIAALVIVCIPMAPRLYMAARKMSSWGFVALSFVLLFAGAAVSLFCKRRQTEQVQAEPVGAAQWGPKP